MIARLTLFEAATHVEQMEASRATLQKPLAPLLRQFSGNADVRVTFGER